MFQNARALEVVDGSVVERDLRGRVAKPDEFDAGRVDPMELEAVAS